MSGHLKQLLNDRNIQFEYDRQVLNSRNTSNTTNKTIRETKQLTTRQMVNRIVKALPEVNSEWVKEYLNNETDGEFSENSVNDWIMHFEKLLNE